MRLNRLLNKRALALCSLLLAGWLAGCGNDANFYITEHWGKWQLRLETRPHPIQAGHNEFLMHIVGPKQELPTGMIVRYRLDPKDPWIQAMPDGLSDVFRRALTVSDPAHAKLYVHLKYYGKETQLIFDLSKTLEQ
ncbi:MAG TPA: hypothetical protein VNH42_06505 [Mariprofundaceae bacterium]|nr:hypothetical protein [Mariprofundaceae bacterium]